jgi:hypothetical protein
LVAVSESELRTTGSTCLKISFLQMRTSDISANQNSTPPRGFYCNALSVYSGRANSKHLRPFSRDQQTLRDAAGGTKW